MASKSLLHLSALSALLAERLVAVTAEDAWISYVPGDLPIVLSVPHGGSLRPSDVPLREDGCLNPDGSCLWTQGCQPKASRCTADVKTDSHTLNIANLMADRLFSLTGSRPHMLVSMLHRSRLDPNRPIGEAAGGIPEMEVAYQSFMENGERARDALTRACRGGLWIDVHGHTQNDKVMLGYELDAARYELTDSELDSITTDYASESTIHHLADNSALRFSALLRGTPALGTQLWGNGVQAVPSMQFPEPGRVEGSYLDGATIVNRFGSRTEGSVDAVQMEIPRKWRFGEGSLGQQQANERFAAAAAESIVGFMRDAYGWDLRQHGGRACQPDLVLSGAPLNAWLSPAALVLAIVVAGAVAPV